MRLQFYFYMSLIYPWVLLSMSLIYPWVLSIHESYLSMSLIYPWILSIHESYVSVNITCLYELVSVSTNLTRMYQSYICVWDLHVWMKLTSLHESYIYACDSSKVTTNKDIKCDRKKNENSRTCCCCGNAETLYPLDAYLINTIWHYVTTHFTQLITFRDNKFNPVMTFRDNSFHPSNDISWQTHVISVMTYTTQHGRGTKKCQSYILIPNQ